MAETVLVRGVGDVGSAVAQALFTAGYRVAIHDRPAPAYGRRGMAFVDAVFDGCAMLGGTLAKRAGNAAIARMLECGRALPISTDGFDELMQAIRPNVLVDARMIKRAVPERQIDLAPLTIGLGPNFVAGITTHMAVETAWGPRLGAVITSGKTLALQGEPRELGGFGRERFVYAPLEGVFETRHGIGDWVEAQERVGELAGLALYAPLPGFLRGLTRAGVPVTRGTKIIEIDPRKTGAVVSGIGERPGRIAQGVLEAVGSRYEHRPRGCRKEGEQT